MLDKYKNTSDDEEEEIVWTRKDANWFQAHLITILHFVIGAQRRQVILQMTIEVILLILFNFEGFSC